MTLLYRHGPLKVFDNMEYANNTVSTESIPNTEIMSSVDYNNNCLLPNNDSALSYSSHWSKYYREHKRFEINEDNCMIYTTDTVHNALAPWVEKRLQGDKNTIYIYI
jgi:hypothetical protein